MFVQFIEGSVSDPSVLRDRLQRWRDDLAAGSGWAGTTAGVADDGTAFVAARFESAEAARANSDRAEQSDWWAETERLFEGSVSFEDHEDAATFRSGGSNDAGFVQVIRGHVNDTEAARELLLGEMPDDARPDVIGGLVGIAPDGTYTTVVYFTSEAAARDGEAAEGDDFSEQMAGSTKHRHASSTSATRGSGPPRELRPGAAARRWGRPREELAAAHPARQVVRHPDARRAGAGALARGTVG